MSRSALGCRRLTRSEPCKQYKCRKGHHGSDLEGGDRLSSQHLGSQLCTGRLIGHPALNCEPNSCGHAVNAGAVAVEGLLPHLARRRQVALPVAAAQMADGCLGRPSRALWLLLRPPCPLKNHRLPSSARV